MAARSSRDELGDEGDRYMSFPARDDDETDLEDVEPEETTGPQEEDDEPVEPITDWNVPSWNELIASLYRPER
jgi:hypothetical protein